MENRRYEIVELLQADLAPMVRPAVRQSVRWSRNRQAMAAAAQPAPDSRAIFAMVLTWSASDDLDIPWQSRVGALRLAVRMNDFPEEPLYTLLVDGNAVADFDDWPSCWQRG